MVVNVFLRDAKLNIVPYQWYGAEPQPFPAPPTKHIPLRPFV